MGSDPTNHFRVELCLYAEYNIAFTVFIDATSANPSEKKKMNADRVGEWEKNGRASSSKRTRHINIRYFFVTDKIKSGEVAVQYCPTDEMISDFFTKPLQGSKFYQFRKVVMDLQE